MYKHFKFLSFIAFLSLSVLLTRASPVLAEVFDVVDTKDTKDIFIYRGDLVSLKVYSLTRIAITSPGFVRIEKADVDAILLVGTKEGATPMYIWDEFGKHRLTVHVLEEDLDIIIERIQDILKNYDLPGISFEKNMKERKVIVKGFYIEDRGKELSRALGPFKKFIINLTKQADILIQVDAQVSELSTSLSKEMGFAWTNELLYREDLPNFAAGSDDFFKIGDFNRTTAIQATVNALITEGKGRILSRPSIVVLNGETSSFLVGGEIPIVTSSTSSGGTTTENVSFRSFGVNINVTPTTKGKKIDIRMTVSISDVAESFGDNASYTTTSANTHLVLNDGQTIVLAGLIKHQESDTRSRTPFLGSIPILGVLFRHSQTPSSEREIVISLTPRILKDEEETEEATAPAEKEDMEEKKSEEMPEEAALMKSEGEGEKVSKEKESPVAQKVVLEQEAGLQELEDKESENLTRLNDLLVEKEEDVPSLEKIEEEEQMKAKTYQDINMPEPADVRKDTLTMLTKDSSTSSVITQYVQTIQSQISNAVSFPYKAKEEGWEGTVKLTMVVLSDGSLTDISIKESSGHSLFDSDAINTATILAPFLPFPAEVDLEELVITLPIVYSQNMHP